jgi:hypothetical protein
MDHSFFAHWPPLFVSLFFLLPFLFLQLLFFFLLESELKLHLSLFLSLFTLAFFKGLATGDELLFEFLNQRGQLLLLLTFCLKGLLLRFQFIMNA